VARQKIVKEIRQSLKATTIWMASRGLGPSGGVHAIWDGWFESVYLWWILAHITCLKRERDGLGVSAARAVISSFRLRSSTNEGVSGQALSK